MPNTDPFFFSSLCNAGLVDCACRVYLYLASSRSEAGKGLIQHAHLVVPGMGVYPVRGRQCLGNLEVRAVAWRDAASRRTTDAVASPYRRGTAPSQGRLRYVSSNTSVANCRRHGHCFRRRQVLGQRTRRFISVVSRRNRPLVIGWNATTVVSVSKTQKASSYCAEPVSRACQPGQDTIHYIAVSPPFRRWPSPVMR